MIVKTLSFMHFAGANTRSWLRMRAAFLSLMLVALPPGALLAQEFPSDPVDHFRSLLAEGVSVDKARESTTYYFGPAVGTEIAVYTCSPDPEPVCLGSRVYTAWDYFLELIRDYKYRADVAVEAMVEHYDPYLASSIAVNWCSPEPKYGCADSPYEEAWSTYVSRVSIDGNPAAAVAAVARVYPGLAQHIGAFVCAEPTCYANEMALVDANELAELNSISPQSNPAKQGSSKYKFANRADSTDPKWRRWLDKIAGKDKPRSPND